MRAFKIAAVVVLAAIAAIFAPMAHADNININPIGAVTAYTPLSWGASGGSGVNNNFFFSPLYQNGFVCVYVYNNNPTNAHNFILNIATTGNPAARTPSDGTWQSVAGTTSFTSTVKASPALPAVFGAFVSGVSQVSINISGSSAAGGSPDTASVVLIQSISACPSNAGTQTNGYPNVIATAPMSATTDSTGRSWIAAGAATNPAAADPFLIVTLAAPAGTGNYNIYWNRVTVSCSAACIISVASVPAGATCSAGTLINAVNGSVAAPAEINVGAACTTSPAQVIFMAVNLTANTPYTIDLQGMMSQSSTTSGIGIYSNGITGTVNATMFFWER